MNTNSGAAYYPTVSGALPFGVGIITVELQDTMGTVVVAASSSDIVENASGSYTAVRTAPIVSNDTSFVVVWRDSRNTEAPSDTETLVVAAGPNLLSGTFYASTDALRSYLGLTADQLPDDLALQPLARAQRDIDSGCGRWVAYTDTGLKFASALGFVYPLTDYEALMLKDATCAQVEFRMTMGEDFMIRGQYERARSTESTWGRVPKLCEPAYTKLAQGGFLKLHARVERPHRVLGEQAGSISAGYDNLSLNRLVSDRRFGDYPRNLGLIPSV